MLQRCSLKPRNNVGTPHTHGTAAGPALTVLLWLQLQLDLLDLMSEIQRVSVQNHEENQNPQVPADLFSVSDPELWTLHHISSSILQMDGF